MWVFVCAWKINFPEVIFNWPCVLVGLTRKFVSVQIFTSNHFQAHAQREREREREPRSLLRPSSSSTTTDWAPVRRTTLHWFRRSHQIALVSSHRATPASIKQGSTPMPLDLASATRSHLRLHRAISPLDRTQSPLSLPSPLNLTGFDEFFSWVLFLLCFCIEEWYYIFVWQLRKCEQQVENVFSMVFSRTQPNTKKYFSKYFLKCNQTLENIFLFLK